MTNPDQQNFASSVLHVHGAILRSLSGDLARLRRMTGDRRCAAFWRIAAAHLNDNAGFGALSRWADLMRLLAMLTPSGDPNRRQEFHSKDARVGTVLLRLDISPARIERLCNGSYEKRRDSLIRTLRGRQIKSIDVVDLGRLMLIDDPAPWQDLARQFFLAEAQAA